MGIRTEQYIFGLRNLVKQFRNYRCLKLVEIGSFEGESTQVFHESGIFSEIYSVDPYMPCSDFNESQMENARKAFANRFQFAYNIIQVKGTIDDFVAKYYKAKKNTLEVDGVYIDADHKFNSVMHDIQVSKDIIQPKLFIAGHDYGEFNCPDVKTAVDTSFGREPDMVFTDNSWLYLQNNHHQK